MHVIDHVIAYSRVTSLIWMRAVTRGVHAAMALTKVSSQKCFGGCQDVFSHDSTSTKCKMTFAVFSPEGVEKEKLPVFYWLSGLTCTHENFMQKTGMQRVAAQYGVVVVVPDTSPRKTTMTS